MPHVGGTSAALPLVSSSQYCVLADAKVVVTTILPCTFQISTLEYGTVHWIPRIAFLFITWHGADVKRVEFHINLCFTVAVHRSQGQTLDRVVLFLRRDVFMHGFLYVGLSTAKFAIPPTMWS